MKSEPTTQTAADEDTIRAIHRRMIDAWNAGDSAAFAAPFTDRADFVAWEWDAFAGTAGNRGVPSADLRYGRERIAPRRRREVCAFLSSRKWKNSGPGVL
jgi:hypothetical protein